VLLKGEKAPHLVTEAMVKQMKPGSVILISRLTKGDVSKTSRPTTIDDPVFIKHGVVHYCVPNMTTAVPRTASMALTNAVIPYLIESMSLGSRGRSRAPQGSLMASAPTTAPARTLLLRRRLG